MKNGKQTRKARRKRNGVGGIGRVSYERTVVIRDGVWRTKYREVRSVALSSKPKENKNDGKYAPGNRTIIKRSYGRANGGLLSSSRSGDGTRGNISRRRDGCTVYAAPAKSKNRRRHDFGDARPFSVAS